MIRTGKDIIIALAILPVLALGLAPLANAAPDNITSANWSYQIYGVNVWSSCVSVNFQPAAGFPYTFTYRGYTQSGTLDGNGCFLVSKQDVGASFSYGVIYTLTVGSSRPTALRVTSPQTLGATIVAVNKLAILLPALGIVSAAALVGAGLYVTRRRR